jgi:hypothetical protein
MECEFNRTSYKRRLDNYSGHKHFTASMQPSKYSKDTFKMRENLKMPSELLGSLQYSTTKSSGVCQTQAYETAVTFRYLGFKTPQILV